MQPDGPAPLTNMNSATPAIEYKQLRSPLHHGETLQIPPLSQAEALWSKNIALDQRGIAIGETVLSDLKRIGRQEVVQLACEYTGRYLEIENPIRSTDNIVMAGHQPELFHPGVWYKNFSLSRLATQFESLAINLIVDNDVCDHPSIRCPQVDGKNIGMGTIPITEPGHSVPFELREIGNWDYFERFPHRANAAIGPLVQNPLVNQIWKFISTRRPNLHELRLGQALAMGRHCLENQAGLNTLEVPISQVSQTSAFASFAKSILTDIEFFQTAYNTALFEYRQVHKVRSQSHPVPQLESNGDWFESPFWVWQMDQPHRRSLFIRRASGLMQLTDRAGWRFEFDAKTFHDQFLQLTTRGIAIRPKALMTTMFSRLVLSDLFLHGIGGAKYDQLTDEIARNFFGVTPPAFMTLSATMKLPHSFKTASRDEISRMGQLVRELQYHPETHIEPDSLERAKSMIDAKTEWIGEVDTLKKSKTRHNSLTQLNRELQSFVSPPMEEAIQSLKNMQAGLRSSEILNSREYSFCLFPESLIRELDAI